MNGLALFDLINGGEQPVATFHDPFEDMETCIDDKMVGRLVSVERMDEAVFALNVDLNDWDEFNDKHAKANYYAPNGGQPELTAKQAGCYPSNGIEKVYLGYDQDLSESITIQDMNVRTIFPVTITKITVVQRKYGTDMVTIWTTLPAPCPALDTTPATLSIDVVKGGGVEYVKTNFGIDPEVINMNG